MNLRRLFRLPEAPTYEPPDFLDHPALRWMSLRELADLPLPRPGESEDHGQSGAERRRHDRAA